MSKIGIAEVFSRKFPLLQNQRVLIRVPRPLDKRGLNLGPNTLYCRILILTPVHGCAVRADHPVLAQKLLPLSVPYSLLLLPSRGCKSIWVVLSKPDIEDWQSASRMAIESTNTSTHEDIILVNPALSVGTNATEEITRVNEPLPEWKPGRQEYLILASLSIISLVVALDASIVAPALTVGHSSLASLGKLSRRRSHN